MKDHSWFLPPHLHTVLFILSCIYLCVCLSHYIMASRGQGIVLLLFVSEMLGPCTAISQELRIKCRPFALAAPYLQPLSASSVSSHTVVPCSVHCGHPGLCLVPRSFLLRAFALAADSSRSALASVSSCLSASTLSPSRGHHHRCI